MDAYSFPLAEFQSWEWAPKDVYSSPLAELQSWDWRVLCQGPV
jgi:hypothetical protein